MVEEVLERQLCTQLEIGEVHVGLFNRVTLRDVSILDQNQASLLKAGLISAKFDIFSLMGGDIALQMVSLWDGHLKVYKNKQGESANIQFIIDAFSSKEKKPSSPLRLRVNSVIVRRFQFHYDEHYKPQTPGRINLAHLGIDNLNANISLKRLTNDSVNLRVRSLQFKEQSGFDVRRLSLRMTANRSHCDISRFALELPETTLRQDSLEADYVLSSLDQFWSTLNVSGKITEAKVSTDDIVPLIPELRPLQLQVRLTSDFSIKPNFIAFNDLHVDEAHQHLDMKASVYLYRQMGLITRAKAQVSSFMLRNEALRRVHQIVAPAATFPIYLERVGDLLFRGKLDYVKQGKSYVHGDLITSAGLLTIDGSGENHSYEGQLKLKDFHVQHLFDQPKLPSLVSLTLKGKARVADRRFVAGAGQLAIEQLAVGRTECRDVLLDFSLQQQQLSAQLVSSNPDADFQLKFRSAFDGRHFKHLALAGTIYHFRPQQFQLTDYFGSADLSGKVNAQLQDFDFKHPVAALQIQDFKLTDQKLERVDNKDYNLQSLKLKCNPIATGMQVMLDSDFAKLELKGPLSLSTLKHVADNVLQRHLPSLSMRQPSHSAEEWNIGLVLRKSDFFKQVLHLPLEFSGDVSLNGYLNASGEKFLFSGVADYLKYQDNELHNLRLLLRDSDDEIFSRLQANRFFKKKDVHLELEVRTHEGKLLSDLLWEDRSGSHYKGMLKVATAFDRDERLRIHSQVFSTEMVINDTLWQIHPGEITVVGDSISVGQLGFSHQDQQLLLHGQCSRHPEDSIVADLQKIDVAYILDLFNIGSVSFGGHATGRVAVQNIFNGLSLSAQLDLPAFYFNQAHLGHALIRGAFNSNDKRIRLWGDIREPDMGYTKVVGYVSPAESSLDLSVDSKNTNVAFLNRYLSDILQDIKGRTTGHCRIFGPFKQLDFEGEEDANIAVTIPATGVRYDVGGGKVVLSKGNFSFQDFTLLSGAKGSGRISGSMRHDHLKNINYRFKVNADDLLVYDKDESVDLPFFATVYGTGDIEFFGKPGRLDADINITPGDRTTLTYTVDSPDAVEDVQFLRFVDAADTLREDRHHTVSNSDGDDDEEEMSTTDIRLNFLVDMNPQASLKVLMDRKSGDYLMVHGYGPIRASFYNKGRFEMFGKLNVQRGYYKMSIQDVIRKNFEFTDGSFINFAGDPFEGNLGLRAIYVVNSASLADLNIGSNLSDNSTRVNCVLNFSGKVKSPQVKFDLELPNASDDVQQMVRNLICTEEDMNMQILYLLGVGRFYTYNFETTEAAENQSQSSVAMKSFLSNTLSSQLNNIISNAMGSSNWSFGANLSTGAIGWSDMEVEGVLTGRLLNNRLLINGNFGYRDRNSYLNNSSTNFVGDFDVQYMLTPNGGINLKAYSETNDRYFSKSSLTTQGAGILLKRDFSSLKDLFTPARKKKNKDKKKAAAADPQKKKRD